MQSSARGNGVPSDRSSACSLSRTATMASSQSSAAFAKKTPSASSSQTALCGVPPTIPPPLAKKATVRFDSSIRIRPIPSLLFMSDEEKKEIWYYESDIAGFKETIRLDVKHMRRQMRQTELSPEHLHINDTDDRCSRGIEHFATRESLLRQETAKSALIESVLREQAHLSATMPSVDTFDGTERRDVRADAIAQAVCDVSMRLSLDARSRAATLGASDRAFIAAEESSLRALLALHNLASHTAQTDTSLATKRGCARSASSVQEETASNAGSSSSSSCLKRSACSVPNMMGHASTSSSASAAAVQAYEQFATQRRRRLSLLRESLLASMTISEDNATQHLQQQQHRP